MKNLLIIFLLTNLLSSCVPAVIGAAAVGTKLAVQDKTLGESVSDSSIWTKIRSGLVAENIDSPVGDVNIKVHEGRVMLTGYIKNQEDSKKITKVCWNQAGVKEVINHLKTRDNSSANASQYAKDSWITTQIKSKMFGNSKVKSINFNIVTIDGEVYLLGIARSKEELDLVNEIIHSVNGVNKLHSHVRIRGQNHDSNSSGKTSAYQEPNQALLDYEYHDNRLSQDAKNQNSTAEKTELDNVLPNKTNEPSQTNKMKVNKPSKEENEKLEKEIFDDENF